ncbi:MAG: replication-associated recombination protein A [Hahellaceae bacterium]|nr:replication-associated recombination protein A [Hahellaceae bacterium]
MNSLFDEESHAGQPLAARMRPKSLSDYVGQAHLLGEGKPLRQSIERHAIHSMVLWGPPGVGKTSFAMMLASLSRARFVTLSAVLSGVKDIRQEVELARQHKQAMGQDTILFVDEVHRFNKSQQDAFLPYVEDGSIIFVGATTENPSFELNNALLSRCRVYILKKLGNDEILELLKNALTGDHVLLAQRIEVADDELDVLARVADGDARKALNLLEIACDLADEVAGRKVVGREILQEVMQTSLKRFDKGGDLFYEQISALHKSVRGSDPDAALYWFVRMISAGCDPLYIARRVVRMASEDIGNADPKALTLALNAWDVQERLGSPEGELAIAQALTYLAVAPKSNAVYSAYKRCLSEVANQPDYDVPMHLRNAPTTLMQKEGFGHSYRYAHDEPGAFAAGECYFPEALAGTRYYEPVERGLEIKILEKLTRLRLQNQQSGFQRFKVED